jgi:hypothetical protein
MKLRLFEFRILETEEEAEKLIEMSKTKEAVKEERAFAFV